MSAIAPPGLTQTPSLTAGIPTLGESATRQKITDTARTFEQTFLSQMLGSMFEGVNDNSAFNGGSGEKAFRSFLNDAMAKQMVTHGGIGLARPVELEMLRLQGLSPLPASGPSTAAPSLPMASPTTARLGASAYTERKS
jgi:Rod binding domain-containing protein